MIRKVCNPLLESVLNHIITIKNLKITVVGEYAIDLHHFFVDAICHGIQPIIRYRILKRIDLVYNLLWDSVHQNNISRVSFKI